MNKVLSWGMYPRNYSFKIKNFNESNLRSNFKLNSIPYGNGRSYGDSCISENIVNFKNHNHFISFLHYALNTIPSYAHISVFYSYLC